MSRSTEIVAEAAERLDFVAKRMFGGVGYFAPNGGIFAAVVTDDALVLKFVFGPNRDALLALGGTPWVYGGQAGKTMTMQEWLVVPDAFYDDIETLREWTERAHRAAPPKRPSPKAERSAKATKTSTKAVKKASANGSPEVATKAPRKLAARRTVTSGASQNRASKKAR